MMTGKLLSDEQLVAYCELMAHPSRKSGRWPASRKKLLLDALALGALSAEQARDHFHVSIAEIEEWRRGVFKARDVQPDRIR